MKTERNILIAFILNLCFSVFEFLGGALSGSVAIVSDAVHDLGDALSIGISYVLEKKSKRPPNDVYTYGCARFSALGGFITTLILFIGSALMIFNSIGRMINPAEIEYNKMILFAVVGVAVNFCAAFLTREGGSLNQKAVNLHMLEDVFGWIVVLIGAVVMRFTDITLIDPIMSIGVSVYILIHAIKNLKEIISVFLEKTPDNVNINEIKERIVSLEGVLSVHHVHIWCLNSGRNVATLHIVSDANPSQIKAAVRNELFNHGVDHVTIELESPTEHCAEMVCPCDSKTEMHHLHHLHHHHHHHHHIGHSH